MYLNSLINSIEPEPNKTISEFADEEYYLQKANSYEHGKYRVDRFPFLRKIMDSLSPADPCKKVVFMKSSQVGGTELMNIVVGYVIRYGLGPVLIAEPTLEMAKAYSKSRLDGMINGVPCLKGLIKDARERDSGNTVLFKEFNGGYITLVGMNSPTGGRMRAIRWVLIDEVDAAPPDSGGEGDIITLFINRSRTYDNRKIYLCSTPTIAGQSRIENAFLEGNQQYYYVPCSNCKTYQKLLWEQIKYKDDDPSTAVHLCSNCEYPMKNHEKTKMLLDGDWKAEKPNNIKSKSFHLSAYYSPVGFYSWENAVAEWIEVNKYKNPEQLKTYVNTVIGETWKEQGHGLDWERLYGRREKYPISIIPSGSYLVVAGVDVQMDRLECQIVSYGRQMECWSIEYLVFMGDPNDISVWKNIDELLAKYYKGEDGKHYQISGMAIDTGYATTAVYQYCRNKPADRVFAVKGSAKLRTLYTQPKYMDIRLRDGKVIPRGCRLWSVGVDIIKRELFSYLKHGRIPKANLEIPYGYIHFPEYDEEFFMQLTAEIEMTKKVGKYGITNEFVNTRPSKRNEALDTLVYCRAAAAILGIDRYTEEHWSRLSGVLSPINTGRRILSKGYKID